MKILLARRDWQIAKVVTCTAVISGFAVGCGPAADSGETGETVAAMPQEVDAMPQEEAYVPPTFVPEPKELDEADIERMMDGLSNWGRWGPDDQLGAANLITPEKRLQALRLATEGISVSLEHPLLTDEADDVPSPFERRMLGVPDPTAEPAFFAGVSDNYNISYHGYSHSHLDSLCHILHNGQMYNGYSADTITEAGCSTSSIINLHGGIVTRGILIDIPRLKGVPYLEPGTPIYVEDLDAWEEMAGVTVQPGDAIFIRTGRWARRAELGPWNVSQQTAGLHASTMPWVKSRDVAFLGSDVAADVVPSLVEGVGLPVHLLTIVAMGVDLFDNQDLEALAETAAELNRWEFTLVAAPLAVENGTGSPLNALAIF
jgi:kynurenine formamidase